MNELNSRKESGSVKSLLAFLLALAPLAFVWQGQWTAYGLEMDEGMVLLYPQMILDGYLPHRDFETFYTPGNLWLLAGVYTLLGNTVEAARTTGLLYHLAIVTGVFLYSLPFGRVAAALSMLVSGFILSLAGLTPFAWFLAIALSMYALYLVVLFYSNKDEKNVPVAVPYVIGLLAGLAVLVRQDIGLAMLLVLCIMFFWSPRKAFYKVLLGIVVALLPLVLHLSMVGFQPLWDNLFAYPIVHTRDARDYPFSAASPANQVLVIASFLSVLQAFLVFLFIRNLNGLQRGVLLVWPLFFFAVVHQMLQRVDHVHIAFVAFLPAGMLFPMLAATLSSKLNIFYKLVMMAPSLAAIAICASNGGVILRFAEKFSRPISAAADGHIVESGSRKFYVRNEGQRASTQAMVDILNLIPGQDLRLVCGAGDFSRAVVNDTFIYFLLYDKYVPGTYFLEFNPGSANREGTRLAEDVANADWVVLNAIYGNWMEPNASHIPGDKSADEVLEREFKFIGAVGNYKLYQKKSHEKSAR